MYIVEMAWRPAITVRRCQDPCCSTSTNLLSPIPSPQSAALYIVYRFMYTVHRIPRPPGHVHVLVQHIIKCPFSQEQRYGGTACEPHTRLNQRLIGLANLLAFFHSTASTRLSISFFSTFPWFLASRSSILIQFSAFSLCTRSPFISPAPIASRSSTPVPLPIQAAAHRSRMILISLCSLDY